MAFYPADYRADTSHLRTVEHGAYFLLILHYWAKEGLPTDDASLARIAGLTAGEWKKMKPTIAAFFDPDWKHKRIEKEIEEAKTKHEARSNAGKKGGIASAASKQNSSNAEAMLNQPQLQPQKKEDTQPSAGPRGGYFFECGVIKLSEKDFLGWQEAFSYLDLRGELTALAEWAGQQEKWFHPVKGALAKRNREVKTKFDLGLAKRSLQPDGQPYPDGII